MSPYQRTLQMHCPFISSKYFAKCCCSKTLHETVSRDLSHYIGLARTVRTFRTWICTPRPYQPIALTNRAVTSVARRQKAATSVSNSAKSFVLREKNYLQIVRNSLKSLRIQWAFCSIPTAPTNVSHPFSLSYLVVAGNAPTAPRGGVRSLPLT